MHAVDIRPCGNSGTLVDICVRDSGRSSYISGKCIDHLIPTWPLGWEVVEGIMSTVSQHQQQLGGVSFKIVPVGRKKTELSEYSMQELEWLKMHAKFSVHAYGPREMKTWLPRQFVCGSKRDQRNNAARMLRWLTNYPFAAYPGFKEQASLEELVNEKLMAIDIEARNRPVYDDIFMVQLVTMEQRFGNFIITKDSTRLAELIVETDFGAVPFKVIDNVKDIAAAAESIVMDYDPLYLTGHNVGNYDLRKLKELGFKPGVRIERGNRQEKTGPVIRGGGGFFRRVDIFGREVIDTAPFAQLYLPTPDNTLVTTYNFMFGRHIKKDTELDKQDKYVVLEEWAQEAKQSYETAKKVMAYGAKDSVESWFLTREILPDIILLSKMLRQRPSAVVCTSRDRLGDEIHEQLQFERLHTYGYRTIGSAKELEKFDIYNEQIGLLDIPKARRAVLDKATVVFPTPFLAGMHQVVQADKYATEVYMAFRAMHEPKHKLILVQRLIDAYLRKAVFDLMHLAQTGLKKRIEEFDLSKETREWMVRLYTPEHPSINVRADWFFGRIFGVRIGEWPATKNVITLNNQVVDAAGRVSSFLGAQDVVNYSSRFVVLNGKVDCSRLEENDLGFSIGTGRLISCQKGRFVVELGGQLVSQGVDIYKRHGRRTQIEREYLPKIFKAYLIDRSRGAALDLAIECLTMMRTGVAKEMVLHATPEVAMNYFDYRDLAQLQERVKMLIKNRVMKGEEFSYGYAIGHEEPVEVPRFFSEEYSVDRERYIDHFFGAEGKRRRKLSKGSISDYLCSMFYDKKNSLAELFSATTEAEIQQARNALLAEQGMLF